MGYKLLTQDLKTQVRTENETQWVVGEWQSPKRTSDTPELCTDTVLHDYDDPWIAVAMNPAHTNIRNQVMYETERGGITISDGLKSGSTLLRIVGAPIELPKPTTTQLLAFGILASLEVYHDPKYVKWAEKWLSGADRSAYAAKIAANAADDAYASAYTDTSAASAADAAAYVAYVADAAAYVADAAAYTDTSAAYAADAAYAAAYAAAHAAAYAAAKTNKTIDWQAIKAKAIATQ